MALARDNPFAVDRVLKVRYRVQSGTWAEFFQRWAAAGYRGAVVGPEGSGKTTLLEDVGDWLESLGAGQALGAGLPTSPQPPTAGALGAGLPTSPQPPTAGLHPTLGAGLQAHQTPSQAPNAWGHRRVPTPPPGTLHERPEVPGFSVPCRVKWIRLSEDFPRWGRGFLRRFSAELEPTDVILFDGAEQLGQWTFRRLVRRTRRAAGLLITAHRPGLLPTVLACETSRRLLREIVEQLIGPEAAKARARTIDRLYTEHDGNLRDALRSLYDLFAVGERAVGGFVPGVFDSNDTTRAVRLR